MPDPIDADLKGPISPPRDNGEVVFAAPWERRAFGLTVALCRSGACDWEDFRSRLIARIAEDERRNYWASWATALEDILRSTAALDRRELDALHRPTSSRRRGSRSARGTSTGGSALVVTGPAG
jgi:nitrile hydratase accessory protein